MRAKLRADLLGAVPCSTPHGHGFTRLESFARDNAGRTLEVLNVTVGHVTLRLSRPAYVVDGEATFGITQVSIPHTWLEVDITKDEFQAWKKVQGAGS